MSDFNLLDEIRKLVDEEGEFNPEAELRKVGFDPDSREFLGMMHEVGEEFMLNTLKRLGMDAFNKPSYVVATIGSAWMVGVVTALRAVGYTEGAKDA